MRKISPLQWILIIMVVLFLITEHEPLLKGDIIGIAHDVRELLADFKEFAKSIFK